MTPFFSFSLRFPWTRDDVPDEADASDEDPSLSEEVLPAVRGPAVQHCDRSSWGFIARDGLELDRCLCSSAQRPFFKTKDDQSFLVRRA